MFAGGTSSSSASDSRSLMALARAFALGATVAAEPARAFALGTAAATATARDRGRGCGLVTRRAVAAVRVARVLVFAVMDILRTSGQAEEKYDDPRTGKPLSTNHAKKHEKRENSATSSSSVGRPSLPLGSLLRGLPGRFADL